MMRISERWDTWIREVLLDNALSSEVSWEVGLAALPDQTTPGSFLGFMVIEIVIPGKTAVMEGQNVPTVISTRGLLPPWAPQNSVQETVRGLLDDLREQRDSGPSPLLKSHEWTLQAPEAESS